MKTIGANNSASKERRFKQRLKKSLRKIRKNWDTMPAGQKWDLTKDVLIAVIVLQLQLIDEDEAEDANNGK
jgi:hypothetical protein